MKTKISILLVVLLCSCSGENLKQNTEQNTAKSPLVNINKKNNTQSNHKEASMFSLFGKKELKNYYVSSPLQGRLIKGGIPMANTKIIRRLTWNDNDKGVVDEFFTDDKGYFDIPAHQVELALGMVQFVGAVTLYVESENDDSNFIWYSPKTRPEIYSDIEKPLKGLVCDLTNEELRVDLESTAVLTRCTWNEMP